MARLNIEDQFWIDVMALVAKLGDQDKAIGQALRFLKFAQEKHRSGQFITETEFKENGFSEFLIGLFAKRIRSKTEANESTIEAKGSDKHFAWLDKKIDAGRRGGKSRSSAKTKHLKQNRPKQTEAKPKPLPLTLPLKFEDKNKELSTTYLGEVAETTTPDIKNPIGYFIGTYRKAFMARYPGVKPDLRGEIQGKIKRFLKDTPLDEALQLIQVYCQLDGHRNWFKTKGHDFETFIQNLNPVRIALASGYDTSKPAEPNWDKIFGASAS